MQPRLSAPHQAAVHQSIALLHWPRVWYDLILWVLVLGPLASPLLRLTGWPLVADAGWLARDLLSRFVCPTPERSYLLFGLPMAVCARCWGATLGLWLARLLVPQYAKLGWLAPLGHGFRRLAWPLRLLICALPFLLWPLEISGIFGVQPPLVWLLLNGAQAGFFAGLFFCSIWPGFWAKRPAG